MARKAIKITNVSKQPVKFNVNRDSKSTIFTTFGIITLLAGKSITVEETRINISVIKNFVNNGIIKTRNLAAEVTPAPEATLDLSFTYTIGGGPAIPMEPDEIITELNPLEFSSSAIVITNDGDLDANVSAASLDPASDATVDGFNTSIIADGGTNSFNLVWGEAFSVFDEDLTITINGVNYIFTFQGTIQGAGS